MRLAEVFTTVLGDDPPIGFAAYDGSRVDVDDAPVIEIRSPRALNYLATARRAELGLARAYVTGAVDVAGDLYAAMRALWNTRVHVTGSDAVRIFSALGGLRLLRRPPLPAREARLSGRRHSKTRDAAAISHHYDVGNDFYEIVLGDAMTYTCALYDRPDAELADAQWAKHDLVARKLRLGEGSRLLDVGCGWGGMVVHAAKHYGARAVGVTLSREQAEWGTRRIKEENLTDIAEIRHGDYRDVTEHDFDAISSIGLTEHVGVENLDAYFRFLFGRLKAGGRLLNHCITKPNGFGPAITRGGFISRYVFPDGSLAPPGVLMSRLGDAGFEVQHEENLREHYALTLAGWVANLEENWGRAVDLVGEETARAWRLYLVGSRLGFEYNRIQLHQMLASKPGAAGLPTMPLRPDW